MAAGFEAILRTPFAGPWRRFVRPVRVLAAAGPVDVIPVLTQVEAAAREGLYAAGFVCYEAAGAFGLPVKDPSPSLPLVCFGLFRPDDVETLESFPGRGSAEVGPWTPSMTHAEYLAAVAAVKSRIEAGDTYQINLTFRLNATFAGDSRALLRDLHAAQAGAWTGYVDIGTHAICSASPELFFSRNGDRIECLPMKGTAARGWWPADDAAQGRALQGSEKNRAENVMIVDMVRNDLGRLARTGTVRVESLFDVERYPLQWQMTSKVTADVEPASLHRTLAALFPSGSVTGAPKHSAMSIIRELESTPRGVYTGAVGYLSPSGRAHFNVAIRTVVVDRDAGSAEFGVGSGIVWDSVDRDEYGECLLKAAMVTGGRPADGASYITGEHPDFRLLETLVWRPVVGFSLLERHLARLQASADCFRFALDGEELRMLLDAAVAELRQPAKIRILLGCDASIVCEALDLLPFPERPLRAALAAEPIDPADVFLFHKTTRRGVYDAARASRPDAEAVILWNTSGEVTEATDFNVVVEISGHKVTPPVACGLLPGTQREELLARGEIIERVVTVAELQSAGRGWLINSVRGMVEFVL